MLYKYNHPSLPPDGIKLDETYEIIINGEKSIIKGNGFITEMPTYKVKILFESIEENDKPKKNNKK